MHKKVQAQVPDFTCHLVGTKLDSMNSTMLKSVENHIGFRKQFRNEEDRFRSILGGALWRTVVCRYWHVMNEDIEVCIGTYGKPGVRNIEQCHFNISHSGNWIVCGVSNLPIGVDIEQFRAMDESLTSWFSPDEQSFINMSRDKNRELCRLWTSKESYVKALGLGLSKSFDTFSVDMTKSRLQVRDCDSSTGWYFTETTLDSDYRISVCSRYPSMPTKVEILSVQDLFREFDSYNNKTI